ncbi:hypothetical protein [Candidatus Pelagibacter sp. HIMB1506]|uniref:hypothetical protein n=1 Tax=Candidatus Pelagibacter sp. HIMB1506 TaxID=3413337 RepID=UPI003F857259
MKIFDTTTYFEEKLMMDLRFNTLDPFVDKFVVCEATFSHSGKKKEINFNKKDFPKFEDKIIHLILDKDPVEESKTNINDLSILRANSIKRIEEQRNFIFKSLQDANPEDYVIYSDNDEIPKLENVNFKENKEKILIFKQKLFYYKFNLSFPRINWYGSKACKLKDLKNISWLRNTKNKKYNFFRIDTFLSNMKYIDLKIIEDGGWHFTNLKTPEELLKKYLNDELHSEFDSNNNKLEDIEYKIRNKFVNYDHLADRKLENEKKQDNRFELTKVSSENLPDYIKKNLEYYKDWID